MASSVLQHGDILLYVMDNLDVDEIFAASLVCKYWNKVSKDKRLWNEKRKEVIELRNIKRKEELEKRKRREGRAKIANSNILGMVFAQTPFHDTCYLILLLISMILGSLRVDNIISTRYVFLFLPGILAFTGWSVKGLSAILQHSKYKNFNRMFDLTGLFTANELFQGHKKFRVHHILFFMFFAIVWISSVLLTIQMEVESVPKWIVFIPVIILFLFTAFISLSHCGNQFLFVRNNISRGLNVAAAVSFYGSLSFLLFIIFSALKVSGKTNWSWAVIHIPLWFLYVLGFSVPVCYYVRSIARQPHKLKEAIRIAVIDWILLAAPWLIFNILLVLKLDNVSHIKTWGILIPLEIQMFLLLIWAALASLNLISEPLGQYLYYGVFGLTRLERIVKDPEAEELVYCWNPAIKNRPRCLVYFFLQ